MRLKIAILVLLLINSYYLYSLSINSEAFVGIENGNVSEKLSNTDGLISKLDWGKPFVVKAGITLGVDIGSVIFNIIAKASIPNGIGVIKDCDYDNLKLIQYSQHENHIDKDFVFLSNIGYSHCFGKFRFTSSIGVYYQNAKFSAWSGYLQERESETSSVSDGRKRQITGNGMSYEQQITIPFIKICLGYRLKKDIQVYACTGYSSCIYADCIDSHYIRKKQFYDMVRGGCAIFASIGCKYKKYKLLVEYQRISSSNNSKVFQSEIGVGFPSNVAADGYTPGFVSDCCQLLFGYCF